MKTTLDLTEYQPTRLPESAITHSMGEAIWRHYGAKIAVDFPSPKTDNQWQLTSQGWVGYIPFNSEFGIALKPKAELCNIFGMLEYAYHLKSFQFLEGFFDCESLEEFYERLANILARLVLDRGRRGFYRAYIPESDNLPYLRGRMDMSHAITKPWDEKLLCHYEEHTGDLEENQILAWTLSRIAQSGMCTELVLPTVRRAYRALQGFVSLRAYHPKECIGRLYNRLNEDYHPMHALCRFFLEHSGPSHQLGDRTMLPFLLNMERLYELFVAEWLKAHLPSEFALRMQERVEIDQKQDLHFDIDLVIYDTKSGASCYVLDTKYKVAPTPSSSDIAQVIAYAQTKGCLSTVLIYPVRLENPIDAWSKNIHIRSLVFSLDGDLELAGQNFLIELLQQ